jgi:hypothetical protein
MRFGKAGTGLSKGRLPAAKLRLGQQFARIKGGPAPIEGELLQRTNR